MLPPLKGDYGLMTVTSIRLRLRGWQNLPTTFTIDIFGICCLSFQATVFLASGAN